MIDIVDKITGETEQAAGGVVGDRSLHREGGKEGAQGPRERRGGPGQGQGRQRAGEVADLERETNLPQRS